MIQADMKAEAEGSGLEDNDSGSQAGKLEESIEDIIVVADLRQAEQVEQGQRQVEIMKETAQKFAEVRQMILAPDPWIAGVIIQIEFL